jgi:hypothetical protein
MVQRSDWSCLAGLKLCHEPGDPTKHVFVSDEGRILAAVLNGLRGSLHPVHDENADNALCGTMQMMEAHVFFVSNGHRPCGRIAVSLSF